jgi:hypothetical protein
MRRILVLCASIFIIFNMLSCLDRNSKAEKAKNMQEGVHKQILDSREQEEKWKGQGAREISDSTQKELDSTKKALDSLDIDNIPK